MITNEKLIVLGLVKLKAVIEPAPIIKRLKWAYIFGPVYIIVTQRKSVIKAVHLFHPEKKFKEIIKRSKWPWYSCPQWVYENIWPQLQVCRELFK